MAGSSDSSSGDGRGDTIYALGFHAGFACRRSGMCCQSGAANIQVEAGERDQISAALAGESLTYPPGLTAPEQVFKTEQSAGSLPVLPVRVPVQEHAAGAPSFLKARESGFCVFMDPEHENDCLIHAQLGEEQLPQVCRSFPRSSSGSEVGTLVSLALSCPTAVAMLFEKSGPFKVVADPPGLGHETLMTHEISQFAPPKLTSEMRLSRESYHQLELRCVEVLSRDDLTPELALLSIASMVEEARVQGTQPVTSPFMKTLVGAGSHPRKLAVLRERLPAGRAPALRHVRTLLGFGEHPNEAVGEMQRLLLSRYGGDEAEAAARFEKDDLRFVARPWEKFSLPLRRYVASRVFDNRLAWETAGMRSTLFALVTMLATVRVLSAVRCGTDGKPLDQGVLEEAIRFTDLLLNFRHISGGVKQTSLAYFDGAEAAEPAAYLASLAL